MAVAAEAQSLAGPSSPLAQRQGADGLRASNGSNGTSAQTNGFANGRESETSRSARQPIPIQERALSADTLPSGGKVAWRPGLPIIIDNGCHELRAGFAASDAASDYPALAMENVVAKYKDRKRNHNYMLAGSDCYVDAQSRSAIRSPFDGDVVTNFELMENILDYAFLNLGIDASSLEQPVLMTETLGNPAYSRGLMNELLFEGYGASSICYGLDSLFAAYYNGITDGLAVSSGRNSTTMVPILDGSGLLDFSKRLNWGGSQAAEYLLKLAQLKYPGFPTRVTLSQATWLRDTLCAAHSGEGESYEEFVGRLSDPDELAKETRAIQFPFAVEAKAEKTQEELDQQAEKRRQAGMRLQEQAQRMRLEKLVQKENDLRYYEDLREWKQKEKKAEYLQRLQNEGFSTENELDSTIKNIQGTLKRHRAKELGEDPDEPQEAPTFPLLDTPDDQLDEEGVKEKRRQRLMKAGYDARQRAKAEKEEEKRLADLELQRDDDDRNNDPRKWAAQKRREYEATIQRIKDRKRKKAMLSDRKSLASQQRMKNITSLASDQPAGAGKRRRRGNDDDNFGADDDDWAIYREIRNDEDSDVSEDETAQLSALESRLLKHDPSFTEADTYDAQLKRKNKLTLTFLRGANPEWNAEDVAQQHQIHLNLERSRVPEVLWKPYLAGVDQGGIDETLSLILGNFDVERRKRLAGNIFVTGQHTQFTGFDRRLQSSVRATQLVDVPVRVVRAKDVRFDAWRGMRKWVLDEQKDFARASISRQDYNEHGAEWFKEHRFCANAGGA